MRKIFSYFGGFLAISGIISTILYLVDFEVEMLAWINSWGSTMGWIIRIGLIVSGVLLFFISGRSAVEEPAAPED